MIERTVYECEYCTKKRYLSKYKTREHEAICWYNSDVKSCNSCGHNYYTACLRTCELGIDTGRIPVTKCSKWEPNKEWEDEDDEPTTDF